MIYHKFTDGWVDQTFDENGKLLSQEFIASAEVDWADFDGNPIDCPDDSWYHPFAMVQPTDKVIPICRDGKTIPTQRDSDICDGDCFTCEYAE